MTVISICYLKDEQYECVTIQEIISKWDIIRSTQSHFHIFIISAVQEKNILLYRDTILNLKQKAHGNQTGNMWFSLFVLVFGDFLSCFSIILYKRHVTCHVTNCHFVNIMTLNLDCI